MRVARSLLALAAPIGLTVALVGATPAGADGATQQFDSTGHGVAWVVPDGVCTVDAFVAGAQGGSATSSAGSDPTAPGGLGGTARATLSVTPGDVLTIVVGGRGANGKSNGTGGAGGGTQSAGGTAGPGNVSFTPVDGNPGTVGSGGAGTGGADAGSGTGPAGTVFGSGTQANDGVVTIAYDTSQGCHAPAARAEPVVAPIRFTG
ncbi:MAG: hypothetical protein FJW77_11085 [Actinobacteria bacterium]|nr:hypothetical protein [Actinomycetota bacterium]